MTDNQAEKARINWGWLGLRLTSWRCRHDWQTGDRATGAKACMRCGVWRWFPAIKTPAGGRAKPGSNRRADGPPQREVAAAPPAGPVIPPASTDGGAS